MKLFAPQTLALALATAAIGLAACSPTTAPATPAAQAKAAEDNLMNRHDSVMAQAGRLFELREKIATAKPANAAPYLRSLQAADGAMMAWMNAYHAPDSTAAAPQRLAYFRQEQAKLDAVEKRLRGTIDSAAALLKQAPGTAAPATK
ncbi:hypothetical protein ACFQ48_02025 [Hymenobacter caeli]|uniref:Viral A-type inclusion protein n=1 Tax=Hymenobacter caeli TaxID=2735894 RepID=A0ABX2FKY3_9BACT|nr:hypothetical protein [Hymenobacter caeli]NRT17602.1 hypothetical protein [Hymenobacter caeli]